MSEGNQARFDNPLEAVDAAERALALPARSLEQDLPGPLPAKTTQPFQFYWQAQNRNKRMYTKMSSTF